MTQIPFIISENAGLDSAEIISDLRTAHVLIGQPCRNGLDVARGKIGDMRELGVFDPFIIKLQTILSATEAAECILRIDETVLNSSRLKEIN